MSDSRAWSIYALRDPRTNQVRYIGWTVSTLKKRLASHKSEAMRKTTDGTWLWNYRKVYWLRSLLHANASPIIGLLEEGFGVGYADAERRWIKHYKDQGADLVNGTDGGDGTLGRKYSNEERARLSARAKSRAAQMSETDRQALSDRTRQQMAHPEMKAHISAKQRERMRDPELRRQISEWNIQRLEANPEALTKVKQSLLLGVTRLWTTPEIREKALVNMRAAAKTKRGENNHNAKLNNAAVQEIRQRALTPYRGLIMELARKFGVDKKLITLVIRREIWIDVPDKAA